MPLIPTQEPPYYTTSTTPGEQWPKKYTALLTQSGTAAPIAVELENTLGASVVWTRQGAGVYEGTLTGAFTTNKTFINWGSNWAGDGYFLIPISASGSVIAGFMSITISNENVILVQINDNPITANVDWSTIGTTSNFPIEVRVYE